MGFTDPGAPGVLCALEKFSSLWDISGKEYGFWYCILVDIFPFFLLYPCAKYLPGGNAVVSVVFFLSLLVGLFAFPFWISLWEPIHFLAESVRARSFFLLLLFSLFLFCCLTELLLNLTS